MICGPLPSTHTWTVHTRLFATRLRPLPRYDEDLVRLVNAAEAMANSLVTCSLREKIEPMVCPLGPPLDQLRWWLEQLCAARSPQRSRE